MNNSQIEFGVFKKVEDGYVFRAPALWLFGASRYFLVNEAQKAEIMEILKLQQPARPVRFGLILGVFIVITVMAWAYFGYHDHDPGISDYFLLIAMLFAAIFVLLQVFAWVQLYRLRPALAHLPRSEDRISFSELRATVQKSPSLKDLILIGASQAFLCAVSLLNVGLALERSVIKGHGSFMLYASSFVAILSAWGAFTYMRRALLKAEQIEAQGPS